ncbi:hypothetical protein KUCAC02_024288, partial [Chaenocephalus aceratus]
QWGVHSEPHSDQWGVHSEPLSDQWGVHSEPLSDQWGVHSEPLSDQWGSAKVEISHDAPVSTHKPNMNSTDMAQCGCSNTALSST